MIIATKGSERQSMNVHLAYGHEKISLRVTPFAIFPAYREPSFDIDHKAFTTGLFRLLPDGKERYTNIAIVISDKTRLCGYPEYLPWVIETLVQRGAAKDNITFYIAYGTHLKQTEDESINSYGSVYHNYTFVHHDCRNASLFESRGTTKRGTPVRIRKDILLSTLIITFGAISHHYFAGFGGGRKLLFPGLGERESIYHNHALFLDVKNKTLAAGCQPGNLDDNPLAEDLMEMETHMPRTISIHGILNSSGKVCSLMTGTRYSDFLSACQVHDGYYRFKSAQQVDLVLASSGGYPKDINFIQAHKSIHHAAAFVKDGGRLVILSECIDKVGSDYFIKFLETGSYASAFSMLTKKYEGNGGTALSMMEKTRRIRIYMLTTLDDEVCRILDVKKITPREINSMLASEKGTIAVIANASMLVK